MVFLVCQGCSYEVPQTVWLKITEIYGVTVLKANVPNQGVGGTVPPLKTAEGSFLLFLVSGSLCVSRLARHNSSLYPHHHAAFSLGLWLHTTNLYGHQSS